MKSEINLANRKAVSDGQHQYLYDAEGRRVAKGTISSWSCDPTANGFQETAGYVLGPGGEQLTEVDGGGTPQHTNVFAAGSLIATYDPDGLHFHLNDWLGTRRVDTDYLGNAQSTYHSLPYGEMVPSTQAISDTEHFFTGKERDAESGNDYFGARYYSSAMGRFLSPDWSVKAEPVPYAKLDNPQSLNLYSYVGNDPLVATDPDGHLPKWLTNLNWSSGGMSSEDLLLYIGIGPRGRNGKAQQQGSAWNITKGIFNALKSSFYLKTEVGTGLDAKVKVGPIKVEVGLKSVREVNAKFNNRGTVKNVDEVNLGIKTGPVTLGPSASREQTIQTGDGSTNYDALIRHGTVIGFGVPVALQALTGRLE